MPVVAIQALRKHDKELKRYQQRHFMMFATSLGRAASILQAHYSKDTKSACQLGPNKPTKIPFASWLINKRVIKHCQRTLCTSTTYCAGD